MSTHQEVREKVRVPTTQTILRVPEALHTKLKYLLLDKGGLTQQDVLEDLIEAYVRTRGAILEPEEDTPVRSVLQRKLATILASGDEEAIQAVTANIELFHSRLRPAIGRK